MCSGLSSGLEGTVDFGGGEAVVNGGFRLDEASPYSTDFVRSGNGTRCPAVPDSDRGGFIAEESADQTGPAAAGADDRDIRRT